MRSREVIGPSQASCIIILFILGTSVTLGIVGQSGNDIWISTILGILAAIPFILIYIKILSYYPGKSIFDILEIAFGKIIGKIIILLYVLFTFHLGALILRNFGEFTNIISLSNTPIIVPMLFMGLFSVWLARAGIEVYGRTAKIMIVLVLFIMLMVYIFALPDFKLELLKPVLGNPPKIILDSAFTAFSFPFAETVVLMGVVFSIDQDNKLKMVYMRGFLIAGLVLTLITVRNLAMLGPRYLEGLNFPSYVAVSRISLNDFFQRIEVTVDLIFLTCAFMKATACLYACCLGMARLLNLRDYRVIVLQTGLLMSYFSYIVYDNTMEMIYFAQKTYKYYAFPFEVIIPLILFITLAIRKKTGRLHMAPENEDPAPEP